MEFLYAMLPYLNIGFFGALFARFTGANLTAIVLCSLLWLGTTPLQTLSMMLTFLVFMQLTTYTQEQRLSFNNLQIFAGWRILIPILFITFMLVANPFYAVAAFVGFFLMEVLLRLYRQLPVAERPSRRQWLLYIGGGLLVSCIGMVLLAVIPPAYYYLLAGLVILAACAFAYQAGKRRDLLAAHWDAVILASYTTLGLFGLDWTDWLIDLRRSFTTPLARALMPVSLTVIFLTFVTMHAYYGTLTLAGLIIALAATVATRLFGRYQVTSRGEFSPIALAMTILVVVCLFLVQPAPLGVVDLLYVKMPISF
ncbi:MAG: hypothetical protein MR209_03740 [Veillonellaceae bacterium]|nr:hypothetical protein [Veillonellaceae bacterium]